MTRTKGIVQRSSKSESGGGRQVNYTHVKSADINIASFIPDLSTKLSLLLFLTCLSHGRYHGEEGR